MRQKKSTVPVLSPKRVGLRAELLRDREPQVADLRSLRQHDMAVAARRLPRRPRRAAAGRSRGRSSYPCRCRKRAASCRAGSVAVRRAAQLLEELREHLQAVDGDLRGARDLFRLVAVVRHDVPRIGDADVDERPLAALARQHEGEDAREIGLERHRQQVEQQPRVIVEPLGHAERLIDAPRAPCGAAFRTAESGARFPGRSPGSRRPSRDRATPRRLWSDRASPTIESRMLASSCCSRRRSASDPPSPNSRSNAVRGLISIGSGEVGEAHEIVFR